MFGRLFGSKKPLVITPWSQRGGFKGAHRKALPGKHRAKARGSGIFPKVRLTPGNDRGRYPFRF